MGKEMTLSLFVALQSAFLGFSVLYIGMNFDRRGLCYEAVLFLTINRHLRSQSP